MHIWKTTGGFARRDIRKGDGELVSDFPSDMIPVL